MLHPEIAPASATTTTPLNAMVIGASNETEDDTITRRRRLDDWQLR
jgi:hypothetical protein